MKRMSWNHKNVDSAVANETKESVTAPHQTVQTNEPHENLLTRALKSLTFEEHQSAMHDIHGVSEVQDDPMMVEQKLVEMEAEICNIESKDEYLKAKELSPGYVENKAFRLMFLRTDMFTPKKAAVRFVKHFQLKKKLFGEEKLGRDILLHDLEPEDWKFCHSRWLQHRDRSGRAICFWTPHTRQQSIESKFRLMFWSIILVLRDRETRERGAVLIFYNVGSTRTPEARFCFALNDYAKAMPLPFVSFHICYDNPKVRPILSWVLLAVGNFLTVRCRSHYGSARECIYSLMTFGIPREALPISEVGKFVPDSEERFLKRLEQEDQPVPTEYVVCIPGRFDVLLGRRKLCQDHVGNLRYRHLVLSYQDDYEKASKFEKTALSEKIIKEVKDKGGHFLSDFYNDYIEVSDVVARRKVAHAFRSQRRIQNRRNSGNLAPPQGPSFGTTSGSDSDAASRPVVGGQLPKISGAKRVCDASM